MRAWPPLLDPCAYCGGPSQNHDHIHARSTGGVDSWHNLTSVCKKCNTRKGVRSLLHFLLNVPVSSDRCPADIPKVERVEWYTKRAKRRRERYTRLRKRTMRMHIAETQLYPHPSLYKFHQTNFMAFRNNSVDNRQKI